MALSHLDRRSAAPDIRRVADPIDFIAEEHWRQRQLLAALERIGRQAPPDLSMAHDLIAHLEREFDAHMRDEDDDLLPLLRRRAAPEDEVERFIARLNGDHSAGRARATLLRALLMRLLQGGAPLTGEERALIAEHVGEERRHLIFENAVILPLARARLTRDDRRSLALRIAARRGVCLTEAGDA